MKAQEIKPVSQKWKSEMQMSFLCLQFMSDLFFLCTYRCRNKENATQMY